MITLTILFAIAWPVTLVVNTGVTIIGVALWKTWPVGIAGFLLLVWVTFAAASYDAFSAIGRAL